MAEERVNRSFLSFSSLFFSRSSEPSCSPFIRSIKPTGILNPRRVNDTISLSSSFVLLHSPLSLSSFPKPIERKRRESGGKGIAWMAAVAASVAKQAELLKAAGNTYFKKDRLGAAIDAYTEAIALSPGVAVYWTNRALCHRKREDWTKVEEDCRKALELDSSSVKAHYMLGLALLEREKYAVGIKELEKALNLGRGANPSSYMVEEIWQILAKAKYMEWERASSKRSWRLQNLKETCEKAMVEQHFLNSPQYEDNHSEQLELLKEVFNKASKADTPADVPDYLCCKITLEIFRDPVITPSGVSYERAVLLEHLQKVGKFDPITRESLEEYQLVPNLAIKEAVQAFLADHGWAYKMS